MSYDRALDLLRPWGAAAGCTRQQAHIAYLRYIDAAGRGDTPRHESMSEAYRVLSENPGTGQRGLWA